MHAAICLVEACTVAQTLLNSPLKIVSFLQRGDVRFGLSKAKKTLFGKQWMLTDNMSFDAHAVVLRSKPLSFSTSFEDEDGSTIAKMIQKCFSLGSQIQWGCSTYM